MTIAGMHIDLADLGTFVVTVLTFVVGARVRYTQVRKAADTEQIVHEVKPNSGASMRDAVDRIEAALLVVAKDVGEVKVTSQQHAERLAVLEDRTYPGLRARLWRR